MAAAPSSVRKACMAEERGAAQKTPRQKKARSARHYGDTFARFDYVRPTYPHNIHPALVPGIGLEEQRRRYGVDRLILGVAGALTVAFVIWGITDPSGVGEVAT